MRSFTIARAAVLPLFGLMLAACSMGNDEDDLALGREDVSDAEKGEVPSQDVAKALPPVEDADVLPVEGEADQATGGEALPVGKDIEQPLPVDLGKGEAIEEPAASEKEFEEVAKGELPPKGELGAKGGMRRPRVDLGAMRELPSKIDLGVKGRLPPKGELGPKGETPPKGDAALGGSCPKANLRTPEIAAACVQAITYAKNPRTGECCVYATPCEVPKEWEGSFSAADVCR